MQHIPEVLDDAKVGIAWWNGLPALGRAYWLGAAGSAMPADAWAKFKQARLDRSDTYLLWQEVQQ